MIIARFIHGGQARWGVVEEGAVRMIDGDVYGGRFSLGQSVGKLDDLKLLAPCTPSKIIGAAQNYHREMMAAEGRLPAVPRFFLKPPTTLNGPFDDVVYPPMSSLVIHEAEVALVMRREAKDISIDQVPDYVLGYTAVNDLTAFDCQRVDGIPDRSKSFDTFTPMGPVLVTDFDWRDVLITCRVNGEVKQQDSTREIIFDPFEYVSFVSQVMTLLPGDVLLTGSPKGMSGMKPGDIVEVHVEGIGTIRNRLVSPRA